jgi:hypothetical protein
MDVWRFILDPTPSLTGPSIPLTNQTLTGDMAQQGATLQFGPLCARTWLPLDEDTTYGTSFRYRGNVAEIHRSRDDRRAVCTIAVIYEMAAGSMLLIVSG